jgi:predicted thioesterase
MPSVLSTPSLIGLLERTARETRQPFLDPNERTAGIEIDLRHLAPTPLGASVTCGARIIGVDGKQVTFQIEARDAHEVVARGIHTRAVVHIESFARLDGSVNFSDPQRCATLATLANARKSILQPGWILR